MLKLSERQTLALSDDVDAALVARIAQYLGDMLPDRAAPLGPDRLRAFAAHCLEGARRFGFTTLRQAARFAAIEMLFGPNFPGGGLPGADAVLADTATDPNERLAALVQLADRRLQGSAR